jgi:hypothetical protein
MAYAKNLPDVTLDAASRTRIALQQTLFDGKLLNFDNSLLFDNQGSGTGAYANNKFNMSVTSGQWLVRQSKKFMHYTSGKSQNAEFTFDNFQAEPNVVKRVGYFSSNAVTPFDSNYDGFWLENDGSTIRLRSSRVGTSTLNIPWTSWDNYAQISTYDWSKFTVIFFDFVWLGGAVLRLFLKTNRGFVLCHTFNYSGTATDTFIASPNQPVRSEIRSSTGSGSIRYICSQVSSEGTDEESGLNTSVSSLSTNAIPSHTVATVGTTYPLLAIRKKTTYRDSPCVVIGASINVSSNADILIWSIQLNPTLSAPLTFGDLTPVNGMEYASGSAAAAITTTVTSQGKVLASGIVTQGQPLTLPNLTRDFLSFLGSKLDNTMDQIVLCVKPVTANITLNGTLSFKEF